MMEEKIKIIIDEWDPIGLFPLAPKDEYSNECHLVYLALQKTKSVLALAQVIHEIFKKSFGNDIFIAPLDKCVEIASTIFQIYDQT